MEYFSQLWAGEVGLCPWAVGGGAVVLLAGVWLFKSSKQPKFRLSDEYKEKDVVYLFQFDRGVQAPNVSPFCIKMEAFLRINNIKHKVVCTGTMSPKGKMPYIAFNGQVVSDSDFAMDFLMRELQPKCDDGLSEADKALGHVICQMLEENTYWTMAHYRWVQAADKVPHVFAKNPSFVTSFILRYLVAPEVRKACHAQGMGRHSVAEISQIAEKDLRSVSTILGDKPYLLGDAMTSYDAAVFGIVSIIVYAGQGSSPHTLVMTELENLVHYCDRIRAKVYPDWDDLLMKD